MSDEGCVIRERGYGTGFPEADHHFHLSHLRCRFSTTAEAMNYILRLSDAPVLWLVEQTFSWFGRNRRLANDFENLVETLATFRYPRLYPAGPQAARQGVGCGSAIQRNGGQQIGL